MCALAMMIKHDSLQEDEAAPNSVDEMKVLAADVIIQRCTKASPVCVHEAL